MTQRDLEPEPPVLNPSVLRALGDAAGADGAEMLEHLVGEFLEGTPPLLANLAAAVRDKDGEQAAEIARRLREGCAGMGAYAMAARCAALAEAPPGSVASLSLAVSVEYRRAVTALKAFRDSLGI
jgi:HPt (histidine-containing phosphotransfer) domain-containing protein